MQKKIEQLKYVMQFFPLRLNFFVFLFFMFVIYRFANQPAADTSSFHHFLVLMSKVGFGILSAILILSLLSTVAACIYFIRHREYFHVQIINSNEELAQPKIEVHTYMDKILRPLLGSVQVRYEYNEHHLSPPFSLSRENSYSLFPSIGHQSDISLPNIKEYKLDAALLSFQDLFRFFSFTFKNSLHSQFVNLPKEVATNPSNIEPKSTETDNVRTNKLRKISGEWLEYKKYEASDDIRRIVWKAFAKNKELIVRKQEVLSPFASHINCYATFYSAKHFSQKSSDKMGDYYKNFIWSFFKELLKSDYEIKLHFEQMRLGTTEKDLIAEQIAQASWQNETQPSRFFDTKKGSVFFLHSLLPTSEIEKVINSCNKNTLVFYVDLTAVFHQYKKMSLLARLFLKPPNKNDEELLRDWRSNPLRIGLKKEIESHHRILKDSLAQIEIIE